MIAKTGTLVVFKFVEGPEISIITLSSTATGATSTSTMTTVTPSPTDSTGKILTKHNELAKFIKFLSNVDLKILSKLIKYRFIEISF